MTHRVRATNEPDKVLEVDDSELLDLRAQGLLIEDSVNEDQDTDEQRPVEVQLTPAVAETKPVESGRRDKATAPVAAENKGA